jgi:hypothetical protein
MDLTLVRRTTAVACLAILAAAGCTEARDAPSAAPSTTAPSSPRPVPPVAASAVPGGCGTTPILLGAQPDWSASAGVPGPSRYVRSHEENLIGVLFGDLLRVPSPPGGPNNKILWISREPRDGQPLHLTLSPMAGGGQPVTLTEPANSSPGEIYPSIVDVAAPGCWSVTAEWNGHRATLELGYVPGPSS